MTWFFLAIVGPFLYAMTNHIDKVLLEKYFKEGGVGTLLLFSSLLSVLSLPILFFIEPDILNISLFNASFLLLIGTLDMLVLFFYFKALQNDEASVVIVFYQLMPLIGLGLGYLILGEVLSHMQLIAAAIILLGTSIISFEIDDENNFKLRRDTIFYMLLASLFWALEATLFKMVALEENVLQTLFWNNVILVLIGIVLFTCISKYRTDFIRVWKENSRAILGVNLTNEILYMVGNTAVSFAIILAPIALILLMESFQPIFVFVIGIILTIFFPQISVENIKAVNLWQKLFAIIITGIGTYMLLVIA